MTAKTYGQACALSASLDIIGSRWTMLILRDLMGGPARYVDIQRGLKGIASNLLNERLKSLEEDGLIEKVDGPNNTTQYQLTDLGEKVRPALDELGKLGLILGSLRPGPRPEPTTLRFFAHAIQALLSDALPAPAAFTVGLNLDDEWFTIQVDHDRVRVTYEMPPPGSPVIESRYELVRDVLVNGVDPDDLMAEATVEPEGSEVLRLFVDLVAASVASRVTP